MKKQIYKWIFENLMGWKIEGYFDKRIEKSVIIVIPHTSWHDVYIAMMCRGVLGEKINWIAKKELFRFPLGLFFKSLGGMPIDRTGGLNKVDAIVRIFEREKIFRFGLYPEGTRKKVEVLKTGFYYIALKANVPIIPVSINFEKKIIDFRKPFYPTANIEADLLILNENFIDAKGKIPENDYIFS